MREIKTTKGSTWKVSGIEMIPSDSIYIKIKESIEEGNLSQAHLQKVTGHRAPITINFNERTILFSSF